MSTNLTTRIGIRVDAATQQVLKQAVQATGKSQSQIVRDLIAQSQQSNKAA
jgi:uncharacterized protein (DUF1778 family)